jgi:hypothetical protein
MDIPYIVGGGLFAFTMVICLAFLHGEGVWGNALTLINMLLATIISLNAFEPVANLLEGFLGGPDYMDVLSLWLVYIIAFLVLRLSTDAISRMKVRFQKNVEQIGTFVFSGLIGCLFYSFMTLSLHTAPIQPNVPSMRFFEGQYYGFLRYESAGALASFLPDREFDRQATSPETNFFGRYLARRVAYSKQQ